MASTRQGDHVPKSACVELTHFLALKIPTADVHEVAINHTHILGKKCPAADQFQKHGLIEIHVALVTCLSPMQYLRDFRMLDPKGLPTRHYLLRV